MENLQRGVHKYRGDGPCPICWLKGKKTNTIEIDKIKRVVSKGLLLV
jgi:hypothetical protein